MDHPNNLDSAFDLLVEDDVVPHGVASEADANLLSLPAGSRPLSEHRKPVEDGVNEAIGRVFAALDSHMEPDFVKVSSGCGQNSKAAHPVPVLRIWASLRLPRALIALARFLRVCSS